MQVAVGEREVWGAEVRVFGLAARDALLRQVPSNLREKLARDLEYILNMSCVGGEHPWVPDLIRKISNEYQLTVDVERRTSDIWSWSRLVEACNFRGCEVLLIDTEGHDAQILRSMIQHCRRDPEAWPDVIQFETMGHCDQLEGRGTEWRVIKDLQMEGYRLIGYSYHNSHLAREVALRRERRLEEWAAKWACRICGVRWKFPYITDHEGIHCRWCKWTSEMEAQHKSDPSASGWTTSGWERRPTEGWGRAR